MAEVDRLRELIGHKNKEAEVDTELADWEKRLLAEFLPTGKPVVSSWQRLEDIPEEVVVIDQSGHRHYKKDGRLYFTAGGNLLGQGWVASVGAGAWNGNSPFDLAAPETPRLPKPADDFFAELGL